MNGKTEVIDMKEIKKNLKEKRKKRKLNLGVWKYFIAIGGVLVAAMIFISVWFYNSRGGLVSITMEDYLTYNKENITKVVYVGSNDAVSKELTPVLQNIANKKNRQYDYFNVEKLSSEEILKVSKVFKETEAYITIPMIVVIKDGKIVDKRTDKNIGVATGIKQGYLNEKTLIDFLKDNNVY